MNPEIREHRAEDVPFIRDQLAEGMRSTYPDLGHLGRISFKERVEACFARYWDDDRRRIWVAEHAGTRVGCLWASESVHPVTEVPDAFVVNLAVLPEARGHGIGRSLMEHGMAYYRARGVRHMRLFVNPANASALALYEALGFTPQTVELRSALDLENSNTPSSR